MTPTDQRSTVDITPHSHTVRDNFGCEVVRGPTHCLFKRGKLYMSALIRRPMRTNKGERPHPEHCETVNRFGDAEVRNFEDRWIVFC
jgi:hypothetical protein